MQKLFTPIFALALVAAPWMVKAQSTTLTFTFTQAAELVASAGADEVICNGETVTLNGSATGGTAPVSYSWSPVDSLSSATVATPSADPSDTTTYTLTTTDDNGCTSMASVTIFVDTCVSVSNLDGVASVMLYPNPNKGNFRVDASLEKSVETFTLKVVTVNGQEIYTSELASPARKFTHEVSLPGVSRGVYFVRMEFDGQTLERKIIVQ